MVEKILSPRILAISLFGTAACLTAVWATRQYGLGVSTDGVDYMFTSLNIVKGNGFISYNASPYSLWPPLYPILLAGFQVFSGFDPLLAAAALNIITGILLAFALGFLISSGISRPVRMGSAGRLNRLSLTDNLFAGADCKQRLSFRFIRCAVSA